MRSGLIAIVLAALALAGCGVKQLPVEESPMPRGFSLEVNERGEYRAVSSDTGTPLSPYFRQNNSKTAAIERAWSQYAYGRAKYPDDPFGHAPAYDWTRLERVQFIKAPTVTAQPMPVADDRTKPPPGWRLQCDQFGAMRLKWPGWSEELWVDAPAGVTRERLLEIMWNLEENARTEREQTWSECE